MKVSYEEKKDGFRLGKAPARGDLRLLNFSDFTTPVAPPPATHFWDKKAKFLLRTFGNTQYGDCTRASQAHMAMRLERLETRRTPQISDEEVIRVYKLMEDELYGGGDNGANEIDALSYWRREEKTFRDTKGRPLIIDAFTKINHSRRDEVKTALAMSGAHGIKVCFRIPLAWQKTVDTGIFDIPEGQQPIGDYLPGSWGGHSLMSRDYDETYIYCPSQWGTPEHKITWRAFATYCDESYQVIDSVDGWRKKNIRGLNLDKLVEAVNDVSTKKIEDVK